MADTVLQHLDGAKLLLGILSRGERRDQVEQLQCDRVCNLLRNAKLSTMDAGKIAHAVHDTGFSAEHATFLTELVAGMICDDGGDDKKFQNYESFPHFLTAELWDGMTPSALFGFLSKHLGLMKPSEGTFQMLAITLLTASEGIDKACGYNSGQKNEYLKSVKRWWASFKDALPPAAMVAPKMWLLPTSPQLLTVSDRKTAYGDDQPVPSRVDVCTVERIRGGNWMRIHPGKKTKEVQGGQLVSVGPSSLPSAEINIQMMQCVASMVKDLLKPECHSRHQPQPDCLPGLIINGKRGPSGLRKAFTVDDLTTSSSAEDSLSPTHAIVSSAPALSPVREADEPTAATLATPVKKESKPHRENVDVATARVLAALEEKSSTKKRDRAAVGAPKAKSPKAPKAHACASAIKMHHEKSRCQFLVRGLKGPSATRQFTYGKDRNYKTEAAARKAAEACVKKGS